MSRRTERKLLSIDAGRTASEIDVITDNAMIQFKSGASRGSEIAAQVKNTEKFTDRPIVDLVNHVSEKGARSVRRAEKKGVLVTNDFGLLVDIIK
ncbi:MAG: hypothetical protein U0166_01485 [Acidobacteriota bacterium]